MSSARQPSDRVALYARVSTERQEKEATIESQIAELRARAAAEGWTIVETYQDNGYSGTTLQRPDLDRLRADARAHRFDRVLVHHPDRLARGKPYLRAIVTDELIGMGIPIVYLKYEVEDSPEGRVMDGMLSLFAEYEREKILDRTRRGRLHKVGEGNLWRGKRPYGWRYTPAPAGQKHGTLEPEPAEVPIVRQMFTWIVEGRTAHWVADELNRRDIPTTLGNRWQTWSVTRVIHNPLHTGAVPTNRYEVREPDAPRVAYRRRRKSSHVERPRAQWTLVERPGIIPPELQAAAQARLADNRRLARRNARADYLLAGLCRCGMPHDEVLGSECGRVLQGKQNDPKWRRVYTCTRLYASVPRRHLCRNRVSADALETAVWTAIVQLLQQPEILVDQMHEAEQRGHAKRRDALRELDRAATQAETAQVKIDKLAARNLEGAIDDATFDRLQPALIAERDSARQRLAEAQRAVQDTGAAVARWADVRAFCTAVADRLADLERPERFAERQELIRTLVQRVTVYPDRVAITGVLPAVSRSTVELPTSAGSPHPVDC